MNHAKATGPRGRIRRTRLFFKPALLAAILALMVPVLSQPGAAAESGTFTAEQTKEIGQIVRDYLIANPEVLVEVSAELEKRRNQAEEGARLKLLSQHKDQIYRSDHDFVLGNPDGKVTVIEFFDYNCGWCKRALNEIKTLTSKDKDLRIVMKEFPIFGDDSNFAAIAALASQKQGKYWAFHQALMKTKRVTKENTLEIAESVGIDVGQLKKDMENPLYKTIVAQNEQLARTLGMEGTPGFIIDTKVNYGYLPADGILKIVGDVRKDGCKIC